MKFNPGDKVVIDCNFFGVVVEPCDKRFPNNDEVVWVKRMGVEKTSLYSTNTIQHVKSDEDSDRVKFLEKEIDKLVKENAELKEDLGNFIRIEKMRSKTNSICQDLKTLTSNLEILKGKATTLANLFEKYSLPF